ncbi:MAG: glycosyltransferase [Gemmatimonadetes bacterium]|nr:glycosyltransferase [Gemmatimonadota bacterium]
MCSELTRQLFEAVSAISEDFEIVYVEDGGTDRSWELIEAEAAADPRVRGFRLSRNFG